MQIIHFTHGATDPLQGFESNGVRYLPLADGSGDIHVSCAHFDPGAAIPAPSLTHATALLVVHGRILIKTTLNARLRISGGMGVVVESEEQYSIESDIGAIVLIIESDALKPNDRGISSPERIAGQTWPSDAAFETTKPSTDY